MARLNIIEGERVAVVEIMGPQPSIPAVLAGSIAVSYGLPLLVFADLHS